MSRVGFVGMGALGSVCATGMAMKGHDVMGYDVDSRKLSYEWAEKHLTYEKTPNRKSVAENAKENNLRFGSLDQVCKHGDIIFIAVQTPHEPQYDGTWPLPKKKKDFNYEYLQAACDCVFTSLRNNRSAKKKRSRKLVVIISTVMPGTLHEKIFPYYKKGSDEFDIIYNPYFIALGSTLFDLFNPEQILVGKEHDLNPAVLTKLTNFYETIVDKPKFFITNIPTAEYAKVQYNCFIGSKILIASQVLEFAEKFNLHKSTKRGNVDIKSYGLDAGKIMEFMQGCTNRLISPKYLIPGGSDSGACHPRDAVAMSYVADEIGMSSDLNQFNMEAREKYIEFLVDNFLSFAKQSKKINSYYIFGTAYKKNVSLITGSYVTLFQRKLATKVDPKSIKTWDPYIDKFKLPSFNGGAYFIGTNHDVFKSFEFPEGSLVYDPWGIIPQRNNIILHRPGRIF